MHLMSVDFPAPLSPSSASTSRSATRSDTSSSATTAPKRLVSPRTSSAASGIGGSRLRRPPPALDRRADDVEPDRGDEDAADGDELPVRADAEQVQPVAD